MDTFQSMCCKHVPPGGGLRKTSGQIWECLGVSQMSLQKLKIEGGLGRLKKVLSFLNEYQMSTYTNKVQQSKTFMLGCLKAKAYLQKRAVISMGE